MADDGDIAPRPSALGPAIRRGWPIITLIAVAAAVASLALTSRRETNYEAAATLLVSPVGQFETTLYATDLIRDGGDASKTADTVAELISSDGVAADTARMLRRNLGRAFTIDDVADAVDVERIGSSDVIAITAKDGDPQLATVISSEYARAVVRARRAQIVPQLRERLGRLREKRSRAPENDYSQRDRLISDIGVIENALASGGDPSLRLEQLPQRASPVPETSRALVVLVALLGGLGIGVAVALAIDRLRRSLRSEQEFLAIRPMPVLGRLPGLSGGQARQAQLPAAALEPMRALAVQLEQLGDTSRRVIVITSPTSAEDPMIVATGLAVALAELGHMTTVVDLDGDARVGEWLASAGRLPGLTLQRVPHDGAGARQRIEAAARGAGWTVVIASSLLERADALQATGEADNVVLVATVGLTDRRSYADALALLDRAGITTSGLVLLNARRRGHNGRTRAVRDAPQPDAAVHAS